MSARCSPLPSHLNPYSPKQYPLNLKHSPSSRSTQPTPLALRMLENRDRISSLDRVSSLTPRPSKYTGPSYTGKQLLEKKLNFRLGHVIKSWISNEKYGQDRPA